MQLWQRYRNLNLIHCLLQYPDYLQEEMTLLNTVRCMVSNSLDLNDPQLTISMLDVTIQYLFETKRFDAQYLRCSPDDNH